MKNPGVPSLVCAATVEPEMARAQLERILGSSTFAKAKSGSRFLRYVVEETLAGRADQIKEYVVGVTVFDRGDDFDPRADAVVRVEATRLRGRLRDYYQAEGSADQLLIELPKGSYVPAFQFRQVVTPEEAPIRLRPRGTMAWAAIGIGVFLILLIVWWGRSRTDPNAAIGSLAVLPFDNLSGDRSQDYLAYGITEDLIVELGRIKRLRVVPPPASARNQGTGKPGPEIARELKADAFLKGSVLRTGNRVRIAGRVLQTGTLRQLWAHSYERDAGDIPALQRETARAIAEAVGAEWPRGQNAPVGDVLRVKPEAYDAYLRGRYYGQHQKKDENEAATSNLENAVAIDPNFAAAYAELAQAYVWRLFLFDPNEKRWEEKAFVAAEKALSLDPGSAVAHVARGRLLWTPGNHFPHDKAIREYRLALASDPNLDEARNQLALIYCHVGYFDQALEESRRAVATNPNNNLAVYRTGQTLVFQGKYDEALSVLRGIPADVNPSLVGYQTAWALFHLGRKDEASAKIAQLLQDDPQDSGGLFTSVQAVLAASAGDVRGTEAKIRFAVEKGRGFGHFHHTAYHIATAFALLNRPEQSVHWLEAAAEDGFPCYPLFESDRNLDPLRKNARFIEFLAKLQKQWIGYKSLF